MCGVVGFVGQPETGSRERFIALCRQSCIRGVHAFGIAWHTPSEGLRVVKGLNFKEVMNAVPDPLPHAIVFHNRYSTSGDFRIMENNQPVSVLGVALVFNGTVDMGTKEEMEARTGYQLTTDNDGEIVLRDFLNGMAFRRISGSTHLTSFAGLVIDAEGKVAAFRNEMRPLWAFKESACTFICSTRDIALRAGFDANNGNPVEPFKLVVL